MSRPNTADTVVKNINMLLECNEMGVASLSQKSGVPVRTIYSILKKERTPGIDTTDEIAKAFGLNGWHLLMPSLSCDLTKNGRLDKLISDYANCPEQAKNYISMVADRDAKYSERTKNGTNDQ